MQLADLQEQIARWKEEGQTIVFTNGCFDILHLGHVTYLKAASQMGDKLVVAVNSDASVRRLGKGEDRPIHDQHARAEVIRSLKPVAGAFVFDEDTPLAAILAIEPDVLVKGGDYDPLETDSSSKSYIVGSKEVLSSGGAVKTIDLVDGYSTTAAIEKMKKGS